MSDNTSLYYNGYLTIYKALGDDNKSEKKTLNACIGQDGSKKIKKSSFFNTSNGAGSNVNDITRKKIFYHFWVTPENVSLATTVIAVGFGSFFFNYYSRRNKSNRYW